VGRFDPGAVNQAFRESDIVLRYAHALDSEARMRGWQTYLTRTDNEAPAPLSGRVRRATEAGASILISIHCNASIKSGAHGTETLYTSAIGLAQKVQASLVKALRLSDRGVKYRDDLAILKFRESALIELGFISNVYDLATLMQPDMPGVVAVEICNAIREPRK
jgi:N-acetylmuramoyl-L-alanine amidase